MTNLEGVILYWQHVLHQNQYLLEPSTQSHIAATIKYLQELQKLKRGEK